MNERCREMLDNVGVDLYIRTALEGLSALEGLGLVKREQKRMRRGFDFDPYLSLSTLVGGGQTRKEAWGFLELRLDQPDKFFCGDDELT